jgi:proteasome-associated ATPase
VASDRETIQKQQEAIEKLTEALEEYKEFAERVATAPQKIATIIERVPEGLLIATDKDQLMVLDAPKLKLEQGDTVTVSTQSGQIIQKIASIESGETGEVQQVHVDGMLIEVDVNGQNYMARPGRFMGKISVGDRIVVDGSKALITALIPKQDSPYKLTDAVKVSWDDVGGLHLAKQLLREAIEYPIKYKKVFDYYHKRPTKGILLWGPPGCGKTLLAKALATSLAEMQGKKESGYMYVKGPEILDKYVGATEQIIRQLFKSAREFGARNGVRAVLFIDEADALLRRRGSGKSSDVENTIVPAFLAEMDGLSNSETDPLVLLATNRPDTLDPAVTRDGRVDRKIKVTRPDQETVRDIFAIHLQDKPSSAQKPAMIRTVVSSLFEDRPLYRLQLKGQAEPTFFHFHHMLSGAMVAGIVDRAVSNAFRRDLNAAKPLGVLEEDLLQAIEESFVESKGMDHTDEINDHADANHLALIAVNRA